MERKIRSFRAITAKGGEVVIDEYQQFVAGDGGSAGEVWLPGAKRLELHGGGGAVEALDERRFQIIASGEIVTS